MNRLSRLPLCHSASRSLVHRLTSSGPRRGLCGTSLATSFRREKQPPPLLLFFTRSLPNKGPAPFLHGTSCSSAAFAEGPRQGKEDVLPGTLCLHHAAASGTSPGFPLAARLNLPSSTAHSWPLPQHSWICHLRTYGKKGPGKISEGLLLRDKPSTGFSFQHLQQLSPLNVADGRSMLTMSQRGTALQRSLPLPSLQLLHAGKCKGR